MALSGVARAFFVVYTGSDINVETKCFSAIFWSAAIAKAEIFFFFSHVFPEFHSEDLQKRL